MQSVTNMHLLGTAVLFEGEFILSKQNLNIKWTNSDIFINETTLCLVYEIREDGCI